MSPISDFEGRWNLQRDTEPGETNEVEKRNDQSLTWDCLEVQHERERNTDRSPLSGTKSVIAVTGSRNRESLDAGYVLKDRPDSGAVGNEQKHSRPRKTTDN